MELTKEFVKSCRSAGLLRDFLLQAMDQIDVMEAENRWHRCDKPNSDGLYDLPPESGEYVIQYELNGKKYVTSATYEADYNDWNELCYGSNVIQWRELPHPKE